MFLIFNAIIAIEHGFSKHYHSPGPFGLGFQHLPRDLAILNAWKTMFDPLIKRSVGRQAHVHETGDILRRSIWRQIMG